MMTEIQTIDGGQKDALLRRANKKNNRGNFSLQAILLYNFDNYPIAFWDTFRACPEVCGRKCKKRVRVCQGPYELACSDGKAEEFSTCAALNVTSTTSKPSGSDNVEGEGTDDEYSMNMDEYEEDGDNKDNEEEEEENAESENEDDTDEDKSQNLSNKHNNMKDRKVRKRRLRKMRKDIQIF